LLQGQFSAGYLLLFLRIWHVFSPHEFFQRYHDGFGLLGEIKSKIYGREDVEKMELQLPSHIDLTELHVVIKVMQKENISIPDNYLQTYAYLALPLAQVPITQGPVSRDVRLKAPDEQFRGWDESGNPCFSDEKWHLVGDKDLRVGDEVAWAFVGLV